MQDRSDLFDLTVDGLTVLIEHETYTLEGHMQAIRVRLAVARKARNFGDFLRTQWDLLPDTLGRMHQNHQVRRRLLAGVRNDVLRHWRARSA